MSDLSFIVGTSDTALPSGQASAPVSTDSAGATGAGSFAGVLSHRLQADQVQGPQEGDAPPQTTAVASDVVSTAGGAPAPVDGKPLPTLAPNQETSPSDQSPASLADAALLAAITQSMPRTVMGTAGGAATVSPESTSGPLNSAAALVNSLNGSTQLPPGEGQTASLDDANMLDTQHLAADISKQIVSVNPGGISLEKPGSRVGNDRTNPPTLVPALLGQSISTPAQRALDNALSEAGLGQRVIPTQAGQGELSQALPARPTGLSSLSNDLNAAMQLAAVTGKTALANRLETALTPSLDMNKGQPLASVTPSGISSTVDDVSGLLSGMQRLNGTTPSGFMPTLPVSTTVGQPGWANEVGQRVSWLAQGEMREAQLQLNPRSLGPVDVRIAYGHDQQLNVSFSAANPVAREALDAALPRLREMFDQQGLNLAGANISHQSFSGQHGQKGGEASSSNPGQWFAEADDLATHALLPNSRLMGDGMIDAYA